MKKDYALKIYFTEKVTATYMFKSSLTLAELKADEEFLKLLAWDYLDENGFTENDPLPIKLEVEEAKKEDAEEYYELLDFIKKFYEYRGYMNTEEGINYGL